jgi:peptidoglycan hydrolase-like protein with peptidoglycan-binding domain
LIVLLVGALTVAGWWLRPGAAPTPPSLLPAAAPTLAPVPAVETLDERPVTVAWTSAPEVPLTTDRGGRVTASDCQAGQSLASGTSPFAVDEVRLLALATRTPPWRDLAFGDRGDDVRSLQEALTALGHSPGDSGWYDGAADAAWRAALAAVGGGFAASQVLWLPAPTALVNRCLVQLGDQLPPGATLATLGGGLTGARVQNWPEGLGQEPRQLVVDGAEAPVDASGVVNEAADLERLAAADSFQRHLSGQDEGPLTAVLRLVEPLVVYSLPPSALVVDGPASGCVLDEDGQVHPVAVVGSKLGRTFVQFANGQPPAQVRLNLPADLTCR